MFFASHLPNAGFGHPTKAGRYPLTPRKDPPSLRVLVGPTPQKRLLFVALSRVGSFGSFV